MIVYLTAILQDNTTKLYLYNIIQTYIQSTLDFNQDIFIYLSLELITIIRTSSDYILKIVKSLYSVPEAGNHWFATYQPYHINNLVMLKLPYDPCLISRYELFDIISLQTKDTLILPNNTFTVI